MLTFDDQHHSIYDKAFPLMKKYGFRGTLFVNSGRFGWQDLMSVQEICILGLEEGWEIGGHSLYHENLSNISEDEAIHSVTQDYNNLKSLGLNPVSFALPKGQCPLFLYPYLNSLYKYIRNSFDYSMHHPINTQNLGYLPFQTGWTASEIKARIYRGIASNEALIIIGFHRFDADTSIFTDNCSSEEFRNTLRFLKDNKFRVLPLKEALAN